MTVTMDTGLMQDIFTILIEKEDSINASIRNVDPSRTGKLLTVLGYIEKYKNGLLFYNDIFEDEEDAFKILFNAALKLPKGDLSKEDQEAFWFFHGIIDNYRITHLGKEIYELSVDNLNLVDFDIDAPFHPTKFMNRHVGEKVVRKVSEYSDFIRGLNSGRWQ